MLGFCKSGHIFNVINNVQNESQPSCLHAIWPSSLSIQNHGQGASKVINTMGFIQISIILLVEIYSITITITAHGTLTACVMKINNFSLFCTVSTKIWAVVITHACDYVVVDNINSYSN